MKKSKITIFIFSIFLGILLAIQFNNVELSTGGVVSSQKSKQLENELKGLKDRRMDLEKELTSLEVKLKGYKDSEQKEDTMMKSLKEEIESYNLLAGYTQVKGKGVQIKLGLSDIDQSETILVYNYEAILAIINLLKSAGAEAISINDERIVLTTELHISSDEEEKLIVNEKPISTPFVIKAIGNPDTLEAALNMRYGVVWNIKTLYSGIKINVEKKENIRIPRFSGNLDFKYARPLE